MGHSKSSVVQNITNKVLNTTDIENINKNLQESATNTVIKSASKCSSSVNQSNSCNFSNLTAAGPITIGGAQKNTATVSFSCINSQTALGEMADSMNQAAIAEMKSFNGTEAAAVLNAAAAAADKSGSLSFGGGSNANIKNVSSTDITNETKMIMGSIFKKNLQNNLTSEMVSECMGNTEQSNQLSASDVRSGTSIAANCNQSNTVEQFQECKTLNEAINKTVNVSLQELQFKVEQSNITKTSAKAEGKAQSENVSTGLIQDAGTAISGVIDSVGNVFGLAAFGAFAPFAVVFCCVCCCLISLCASSYFATKSAGGAAPPPSNIPSMPSMPYRPVRRRMSGGYSDNSNNSDIIDYLGVLSLNTLSEILSDSSL